MKSILTLFIACVMYPVVYAATIQGYVFDNSNARPIVGADIILPEIKLKASTNIKGFFRIENVPAGRHCLRINYLRYIRIEDTIKINDEKIIERTFWLESGRVPVYTSEETENYHNYLAGFHPDSLLAIVLDSIKMTTKDNSLFALYSTFKNLTDSAVYVIRDTSCLRMVNIFILNSDYIAMKKNSTFIDCVGEKIRPDSTDFFKIEPHSELKYPPVYMYFNRLRRYPADDYYIFLEYRNYKPSSVPGFFPNPALYKDKLIKEKYYLGMALRGKYLSRNFIKFNTSAIAK